MFWIFKAMDDTHSSSTRGRSKWELAIAQECSDSAYQNIQKQVQEEDHADIKHPAMNWPITRVLLIARLPSHQLAIGREL